MKFAYMVMFELRSLKYNIEKLYSHLIDVYDADIILLCQKNYDDDEERLKLFNRNVRFAKFYDKPNIIDYFNFDCEKDIDYFPINNNDNSAAWRLFQNYQVYINMNEMAKVVKDYINDYDYFILFRLDTDILFPFPDKQIFERIPHGVYAFDAEYARYAGLREFNFIHKDFILDCLTSYYDYIKDDTNDIKWLNSVINPFLLLKELTPELIIDDNNVDEEFKKDRKICSKILLNLAFHKKKIQLNYIKHINYYINASEDDKYTTTADIKYSKDCDVYYKYIYQLHEAIANFFLYHSRNYRWSYKDGNILLLQEKK